jgi:hypothetical protein
MRTSLPLTLGAVLALAGCGGGEDREIAAKTHAAKTTYADLTVEGEDLSKANRYYSEGNQLYMKGGVGVPERERKRNLALAIKRYQAAQAVYRRALRRHPEHISLSNRVREVDMHIDGCRRMMNLNISEGKIYK